MNIIFHMPLPFELNAKSASGIRPVKLYDTFCKLGYNVDLITGYAKERKEKLKLVKKKINKGYYYDFCYSESSTMPSMLTEKNHLPFHSNIELNLFKLCKKSKIPIKLFYRDIYWKFDDYYKQVKFPYSLIAKYFYKYDLRLYKKYLDILYLPTIEMGAYIPELKNVHEEQLPSGTTIKFGETDIVEDGINLIYVGGIGNHYNLKKVFNVVSKLSWVNLLICVRIDDWNKVKGEYPLSDNIKIIHASGEELSNLYSKSNIAVLNVDPSEYWKFAAPYKLFEYLSYGKPIITTKGTWVGEFVESESIGWNIDYTEEALIKLLGFLKSNRNHILEITQKARECSAKNTWIERCKFIARG